MVNEPIDKHQDAEILLIRLLFKIQIRTLTVRNTLIVILGDDASVMSVCLFICVDL